jgi:hypothetical protein
MPTPSPNLLLVIFIFTFSFTAIFHRGSHDSSPPNVFSRYRADILVPSTNDTFVSRPAAFGLVFQEVISGDLITAWDVLACDPPKDQEMYRGRMILVQRGKCTFAEKARMVQQVGGTAIIVGDNVPSSGSLLTMYAKGIVSSAADAC